MVSATIGPVLQHSTRLVSGVSAAVSNAISHANHEAERHAQRHYKARDEYMSRRRLSPRSPAPRGDPTHAPAYAPDVVDSTALTSEPGEPAARRAGSSMPKSALLLRMAALRKTDPLGSAVDENAVEQFFPVWVKERRNGVQWNEDAVLHDLVLAVSQLATAVSIDTESREPMDVM